MMILRDSAGKLAWGFIGAAGTGQTLGSEILANTGFEDAGSGTPFQSWSSVDRNGSVITRDTTVFKSGVASAKITGSTSGSAAYLYKDFSVTNKKAYTVTVNGRGDGTNSGAILIYNVTASADILSVATIGYNVTTTTWTAKSYTFAVPAGCSSARFQMYGKAAVPGANTWFDDLSIKEVLTPSAKGVYIYKDAARTLQGWNMEASFSMNDTSYTFDVVADCKVEGTVVLDWVPGSIPPASQIGIVSSNAAVDSMLSVASGASATRAYDATTAITGGATLVTGTTRKLILRWNSATRQYRISSVAAGVVTHGTAGNFDGAFTLGANLLLHYSNAYPAKYSGLKLFKRYLTDNELMRLQ
jgi:hypothetical protein